MNRRVEKFKFRRQLRKIDWDSVIKVTTQTSKVKSKCKELAKAAGEVW